MERRIDQFHKTVEEQHQREKEAANFKAKPSKVLYQEPFVPNTTVKTVCEPLDIELHSERRAKDRETYEQKKKEREAALEVAKQEVRMKRIFTLLMIDKGRCCSICSSKSEDSKKKSLRSSAFAVKLFSKPSPFVNTSLSRFINPRSH